MRISKKRTKSLTRFKVDYLKISHMMNKFDRNKSILLPSYIGFQWSDRRQYPVSECPLSGRSVTKTSYLLFLFYVRVFYYLISSAR